MKCTFCDHPDTYISNSRPVNTSLEVRRNRVCKNCNKRFATMERVDLKTIVVLSKEGKKMQFDKERLFKSIEKAVEKCISKNMIEQVAESVIQRTRKENEKKMIASQEVSRTVVDILLELDRTACIRYASMHLNLNDLSELVQKISS